MDLRHVSTGGGWCLLALPRDCSLDLESLLAINIAT
jgi:hypothetical protein